MVSSCGRRPTIVADMDGVAVVTKFNVIETTYAVVLNFHPFLQKWIKFLPYKRAFINTHVQKQ